MAVDSHPGGWQKEQQQANAYILAKLFHHILFSLMAAKKSIFFDALVTIQREQKVQYLG